MNINIRHMAKWLRILCAVALLSIGFAHKPMAAVVLPVADLAAYQLPDGSFAELCTVHDSEIAKGKMVDHGCDACRLSASVLVPVAPVVAGDILRVSTAAAGFERPESVRHRLYPPNSGPRAPPTFLMTV